MKHALAALLLVSSLIWIACKSSDSKEPPPLTPAKSFLEAYPDATGDEEISFRVTNLGGGQARVELIDNHIRVERNGKTFHVRVTPEGATDWFIKDVIEIDPGEPISRDG